MKAVFSKEFWLISVDNSISRSQQTRYLNSSGFSFLSKMSVLDHTDNPGLLGEITHIKAEKKNVQDKHKISCNGEEKKCSKNEIPRNKFNKRSIRLIYLKQQIIVERN